MTDVTRPEPWDRVAGGYAALAAAHFAPYADAALRLAAVEAGERGLDVATGPGTLAIPAARSAVVTAVDFSPEMVARVEARAAEHRVALTARVADGQALPFDDGSFDAAFSMFGLFMFPDRAAGFRELARVLRPGGRAVVGTWLERAEDHPFTLAGQVLRPENAPAMGDTPVTGGGMPLSAPSDLRREMSAAGFEVTVERFDHALRFASAGAVASDMLRSHVGFASLEATSEAATFGRVALRLQAVLRDARGEGPVEVPLSAWLARGVKP